MTFLTPHAGAAAAAAALLGAAAALRVLRAHARARACFSATVDYLRMLFAFCIELHIVFCPRVCLCVSVSVYTNYIL